MTRAQLIGLYLILVTLVILWSIICRALIPEPGLRTAVGLVGGFAIVFLGMERLKRFL